MSPERIELRPGREHRFWLCAGVFAGMAGIGLSGLFWAWQLVLTLTLVAVGLWQARLPRPRAVRLSPREWHLELSDGRALVAHAGTTLSLWPGVVIFHCGWRRLPVFADQCTTADYRRIRRAIRLGSDR